MSNLASTWVSMAVTIFGFGSIGCAHQGEAGPHDGGHHAEGGHHEGGDGATMHHRFDDADRWASVFDAPDRDAWQRPDVVIGALVTRPDLRVVDLGAGTGYFTVRFARAVPSGAVVAADIEPTLIEHIRGRIAGEALGNVEAQLGAPDDPKLGAWAGRIDLVFVCDTYHHIGDRVAYFSRVRSLLAPGGRVAIVDFEPDSPRGPPREHKIAAEQVIDELGRAGFRLVARHPGLPDQYLLELTAAP